MGNNWKNLFVLCLVQWMVPVHFVAETDVIEAIQVVNKYEKCHDELISAFKLIQETYVKLTDLNLDPVELEVFKLIVLLRIGKLLIFFYSFILRH